MQLSISLPRIRSEALLPAWIAGGALCIAAALRLALLRLGAVPFNGDEAVVGLMARHILQGERPVFFYGQAYMGSLDAWLVAAAFALFGESVAAIRLVQTGLYLLFMLTTWLLARQWFTDPAVAALAIWLAAIPSVLVTTYTSASLGGYGETLLFGNLLLLLGRSVAVGGWQRRPWAWLALGLAGGLAFWTLGLSVVYLLPVAALCLVKFQRRLIPSYLLAAAGFLAGSLPWWSYNLLQQNAALNVLLAPGQNQTTPFEHLSGFLLLGAPALAGVRFPWSPDFAPWPVFLALLLLHLAAAAYLLVGLRRGRPALAPGGRALLSLLVAFFLAIFLFTRFGADATGRYLLPLVTPLLLALAALAAALFRWRRLAGLGFLALFLLLNGFQTARAALSPDRITTQFGPLTRFDNSFDDELIAFLRSQGELRGYTNYWVSFRLAFLSNEEIIYAARLPYKAELAVPATDSRYPPYDEQAAASPRLAYITTQAPALDDLLRRRFEALGVGFAERQIGPYHIFYGLTRRVGLDETGLRAAAP